MKSQLIAIVAAVLLVGCGPSTPDISIHDAAMNGNIKAVKQHLAAGTDVNDKGLFGGTPLIFAEKREIIELLIGAGADVNYSPENGITPLANAVIREDKESAKLLISSGADVNSKDRQGHTPLDTANDIVTSKAALKEITDLLRKQGGKAGEELNNPLCTSDYYIYLLADLPLSAYVLYRLISALPFP